MRMMLILFVIFLILPTVVNAYDYCVTSGFSYTSCTCSGTTNCGVDVSIRIPGVNGYVYNAYIQGSTTFSQGSGVYATKNIYQYQIYSNAFERISTTSCDQATGLGFQNTNLPIKIQNNTLIIRNEIIRCSGSSSVNVNGCSLTQFCYDQYKVQVTVTDLTGPIPRANISYYYWTGNQYFYVTSVLTDDSGSAVLDMCFECKFKLNVSAIGYISKESAITVSNNQYTFTLEKRFSGFSSLFSDVVYNIEPLNSYISRLEDMNQTVNVTVNSFNNTLEWVSLNITRYPDGVLLFFNNTTTTSGATIYGRFNNTYSNVTRVKLQIKAVGYDVVEINKYYFTQPKIEGDFLTVDGMLKLIASQNISTTGMRDDSAKKIFLSIFVSIFLFTASIYIGAHTTGFAYFGGGLVILILIIILASYGIIDVGIAALTGFIVIGISLLFSGVL